MQRLSAFPLGLVAAAALILGTVAACSSNSAAGSPDAGEDATAVEASQASDAGEGRDGSDTLCNAGCLCNPADACPKGCYLEQSFESDGAAMPLYCGNGITTCGLGGWSFGEPMNNCGIGTPIYVDGAPDGAFCCANGPEKKFDAGDAAAADTGVDVATDAAADASAE